jgi:hypothetical protein
VKVVDAPSEGKADYRVTAEENAMRVRRVAVVAVLMLTSAGHASAECAWVLWGVLGTAPQPPQFLPVGGFHTKEECEADGRARPFDGKWFCLPDTVDPRGPKGK